MQTCYAGVCRTYTPPDVGAPPRGHQIKSRESEHASNLGSLGQSSFHDWEESLPSTLPCMQDTENPTTKPQGRGKSSTSIFRFLPLVCCVEDADLLLWSMSYIHEVITTPYVCQVNITNVIPWGACCIGNKMKMCIILHCRPRVCWPTRYRCIAVERAKYCILHQHLGDGLSCKWVIGL